MNIQQVSQFFEKMSVNPDLQKEFVELAARHGIDLPDDALSEADLATVSGGTEDAVNFRLQSYMDQRSKSFSILSDLMKKSSDTQDAIIANLK